MRLFIFLCLWSLSFLVIACRSTVDSDHVSYAFNDDQVVLGGVVEKQLADLNPPDSSFLKRSSRFANEIDKLLKQSEELKKRGESVRTDSFNQSWQKLKQDITIHLETLSAEDVKKWIALNDSLLKYSGEVYFADELEKIVYSVPIPGVIPEKMIRSFCYTRLLDRIYVNLFGRSQTQYQHTTGGTVRLVQDTHYPYDGKITIKIETGDTRYLDLFIRIPEWAEQSSVTMKGVLYNSHPGNYAEIARKWKNGDVVEIVLGLRPDTIRENRSIAFTYGPMMLAYSSHADSTISFRDSDPFRHLRLVSPIGEMPAFTFSGIPDETLVLQPFFAERDSGIGKTVWIKTSE